MEYNCYYPNCSRSYNSKYNLKRHINMNHLHLKSYPCNQCEKTFASKKNLMNHSATHSEIEIDKVDFSMKRKHKPHNVSSYDIKPFCLSKMYKDTPSYIVSNPTIAKQYIPSLPPVDTCREVHQKNIKIPLLPVLLNFVRT